MADSEVIVERVVSFQTRADLVQADLILREANWRVVKDPVALKYFHLQPEQYCVLDLLKREVSLRELRERVQEQYPSSYVTYADVQSLIIDLYQKGLLLHRRSGQAAPLAARRFRRNWQRWGRSLLNPFFIKLPGANPEALLQAIKPLLGWAFRPTGYGLCICLMIFAGLRFAAQYEELRQQLPGFEQFFAWPNVVFLWLTLGVTKCVHELGHALACACYGCRCHSIGAALIVFSPTMYCDATDAWMLPSKWKRIAVAFAGMYAEGVFASIALLLWCHLQVGLLANLALNVFFVSAFSTVVFNANPLVKFDGYFALSDFLEVPNLREKASTAIQHSFVWLVGLKPPISPFMPESGWIAFGAYAILATLYGWTVTVSIAIGMHAILKPFGLGSLGIASGTLAIALSLVGMVVRSGKTIYQSDAQQWNKLRFRKTVVASALIAILACIPVPMPLSSHFHLEPVNGIAVANMQEGVVKSLHVRPGMRVRAGDTLAELHNEVVEDRLDELAVELSVAHAALQTHRLLDEQAAIAIAEEVVLRLTEELNKWRQRAAGLRIAAVQDGILIEAEQQKELTVEMTREALPRWSGDPLDARNVGAYLDRGTRIGSLAAGNRFEAILFLDQHDRRDIQVGQHVRLLCDAYPETILNGSVSHISDRAIEFVPRSLSNKAGGPMSTTSDHQGRERIASQVYQVRVALPPTSLIFKHGMRGTARVLVLERSLIGWAWQMIWRNFVFRM